MLTIWESGIFCVVFLFPLLRWLPLLPSPETCVPCEHPTVVTSISHSPISPASPSHKAVTGQDTAISCTCLCCWFFFTDLDNVSQTMDSLKPPLIQISPGPGGDWKKASLKLGATLSRPVRREKPGSHGGSLSSFLVPCFIPS